MHNSCDNFQFNFLSKNGTLDFETRIIYVKKYRLFITVFSMTYWMKTVLPNELIFLICTLLMEAWQATPAESALNRAVKEAALPQVFYACIIKRCHVKSKELE